MTLAHGCKCVFAGCCVTKTSGAIKVTLPRLGVSGADGRLFLG